MLEHRMLGDLDYLHIMMITDPVYLGRIEDLIDSAPLLASAKYDRSGCKRNQSSTSYNPSYDS